IQMRSLIVALALVFGSFAYKDGMLASNRIPEQAVTVIQDTCGECKSIVHSIIAAIDDPQKLAELKVLLAVLCHATPFESECKLMVSVIDVVIKRIEPFLRDEEKVCKKLHLCANPKLTNFHRIGMLYLEKARNDGKDTVSSANDFVCDECQMAAIEFKKVIDNEKERAAIKTWISENICKRIHKYQGACDLLLEEYLPEIWKALDALLANPNQACAQLGFCAKQAGLPMNKIAFLYNGLKSI
ncbi:hypothetical protein PMAYCL1PPCAC_25810, partial [Pristionchus mayeri]